MSAHLNAKYTTQSGDGGGGELDDDDDGDDDHDKEVMSREWGNWEQLSW